MGEVVEMKPSQEMFLPTGSTQAGTGRTKSLIVIAGESGAGKSHMVRQTVLDKDYGPDEVFVFMAEDSTGTYGLPLPHYVRCTTFDVAQAKMKEFVRAAEAGKRVPKIAFVDSISGIGDYQKLSYEDNPHTSDKTGQRDKYSEFGDLGDAGRRFALLCRDEAPFDVIWFVTATPPTGGSPEYCIAGKVIPSNINRWSSNTFYLKPELSQVEVAKLLSLGEKAEAPHRTIVRNEKGQPTGEVINRYLISMHNGEVRAKGHRNLWQIEKAYLPDVLRKIKGEPNAAV